MSRPGSPPRATAPFEVVSADGTPVAVWADGHGPSLVLVHASMDDHAGLDGLVAELRGGLATFSMDRRGRGASGDAGGYALEREFEDVAAVVEAVADRTGGPVALLGDSFGAGCAIGAATLTGRVGHLVLYEPTLGRDHAGPTVELVERAVASGDPEAAVLAVLGGVMGATEEEVEAARSAPSWPRWVAAAATVARELRAERDWAYPPGGLDALAAPTLVLAGSDSGQAQNRATIRAVAAIAGSRLRVLAGHGHLAGAEPPAAAAGIVRRFLASRQV